eukprot:scaffold50625_cov46-Attheya_sp.AAC.1
MKRDVLVRTSTSVGTGTKLSCLINTRKRQDFETPAPKGQPHLFQQSATPFRRLVQQTSWERVHKKVQMKPTISNPVKKYPEDIWMLIGSKEES